MTYDDLSRTDLIRMFESERDRRVALEARAPQRGDELRRVIHELQVHQVELEVQNQALREAQGQLEASRSRYADLYDFAPVAYFTFDSFGVILEANLTAASMLGKERRQIVGRTFKSQVKLTDFEDFSRHIKAASDSPVPIVGEIAFSAGERSIEAQMVSVCAPGPSRVKSCRTALLDITLRRVAERDAQDAHKLERDAQSAHRLERGLRRRIEAVEHAVASVSAALASVSGTDLREFLQVIVDQARAVLNVKYAALGIGGHGEKPFAPFVFSGVSAEQAKAIARTPRAVGVLGAVVQSGRPIRLSNLRDHAGFSGLPAHHPPIETFLGVPIFYQGRSQGHLYLANKRDGAEFTEEDQHLAESLADRVGVAMEIGRLRQIEAREHTRLRFLAEAGGALMAETIDYEATLRAIAHLVVPQVADLSTIDLVEEGNGVRKVIAYHPDPTKQALLDRLVGITALDRLPDTVRAAIKTGKPQQYDVTPDFLSSSVPDAEFRTILGELGVCSTILAPLLIRGRVIGLLRLAMAESGRRYGEEDVTLAREIAHHAAHAIETGRLYQAARTAIRSRDNLLDVVSHDLRNYLSTIRMAAMLISSGNPAIERRAGARFIESIKSSVSRMDRLIEGLRDATMIESGQLQLSTKVEHVIELLEEVRRSLGPQALARSISLRVEVDRSVEGLFCDRERVLQVFANLVGNALKFTDSGGEIRLAVKLSPDPGWVILSVSDSGSGIPEPQLANIFERGWSGASHQQRSSGLGLFIVKGIIQAHGGTIWVDSRPGRGTTFSFTLPAAHDLAEPTDDATSRTERSPAEDTPAGSTDQTAG